MPVTHRSWVAHCARSPDNLGNMVDRLDDLMRSFQRDLRAEGRATRTTVIYGQAIRFFSDWVQAQECRPATLDELTRSAIRAWLADLAETHEPGTVQTRFRSLRRFCNWLVSEDLLTTSPMTGMSVPTAPAKPVPVLSDADLSALLKACGGKSFYDRRDEAIFRLLLDCGLRVSELCGLTVEQVDLDAETAIVRGKGNKTRAVYFSSKTARSLDRYLRERRRHRHASEAAFFLGERGATTPDGVREICRVRGAAAGLKGLHPHQLRHTFAHDFLMSGGQERDLKRLAGWSSDTMLERYGASAADARARESARRMRRGDRV